MQQRIVAAAQLARVPPVWHLSNSIHRPRTTVCRSQRKPVSSRQLMSAAAAAAANNSTSATSDIVDSRNPEDTAAEDLVQYVVIRKDLWTSLNWPLGSIVAQACHAATAALWLSRDSIATNAYCAGQNLEHMHKVVLEVKGEQQLHTLAKRLTDNNIAHKLWIEQPEDFPTCLATAPCSKAEVQQHFKKFQLCKGV